METYQKIDLFIKTVGFGATAIGVFIAANTLKNNSKTLQRNNLLERTKWLSQLHDKFFVENKYAEIRKLLDYKEPAKDYALLSECFPKKEDFSNADWQEKLVAYLNFFEFITALEKSQQLSLPEINTAFGYYISRLNDHEWLRNSLADCEFKNLPQLISRIKH